MLIEHDGVIDPWQPSFQPCCCSGGGHHYYGGHPISITSAGACDCGSNLDTMWMIQRAKTHLAIHLVFICRNVLFPVTCPELIPLQRTCINVFENTIVSGRSTLSICLSPHSSPQKGRSLGVVVASFPQDIQPTWNDHRSQMITPSFFSGSTSNLRESTSSSFTFWISNPTCTPGSFHFFNFFPPLALEFDRNTMLRLNQGLRLPGFVQVEKGQQLKVEETKTSLILGVLGFKTSGKSFFEHPKKCSSRKIEKGAITISDKIQAVYWFQVLVFTFCMCIPVYRGTHLGDLLQGRACGMGKHSL